MKTVGIMNVKRNVVRFLSNHVRSIWAASDCQHLEMASCFKHEGEKTHSATDQSWIVLLDL